MMHTLRVACLSVACSLLAALPTSQSVAADPTPRQVVYKTVGDRELTLSVAAPADLKVDEPRPAIVFFHGGGWTGGKPTQFDEASRYFVSRGLSCIQVEYRLLDKQGNEPPLVCVQDAKSAMRFVRSHAGAWGIDPARIAAGGGSAGGHLAAFVGLVEGQDDPQDDLSVSPKANALLLFNPVFNNGPGPEGWGQKRVGDRYREFSPAHNVTSAAPPAIVFLGSEDNLIPVSVAEQFDKAMEQAGVRCDTHIYEGQGHGFFNYKPGNAYYVETIIAADKFLASLGWLEGEPTLTVSTSYQAPADDEAARRERRRQRRAAPQAPAGGNAPQTAPRPQPERPAATGQDVGQNVATPIERIKAMKGFHVELLYSVPNADQGSWVNLCLDGKGRILVSDQYGGLYRFAAPPAGKLLDPATIEKVPADIRAVNGMVWYRDALYAAVNDYEDKMEDGVYRLTDSDGDDMLDHVEQLMGMEARGDHGVHAMIPSPDGESLFLITGNGSKPAPYTDSRVPTNWGEDHLLPRLPDGRGFMRDVLAPGGIIYELSPDASEFVVYSTGYRNIFDGAINRDGELFTYDADMEYDFNTPWYRPTRVNHVTSGSEYGWRNGAGKRPEWYPDNLPAVINIGPGSPTGVTFGYGAKFPPKYQEACFILDWSWGKLYAVHLVPSGSTYTAVREEFVAGTPLPLTDAIINPADGAMYFTIGGRKVQSGVYRVTYVGSESTEPVEPTVDRAAKAARELRRSLERFHLGDHPDAIQQAWPHLDSKDRFIRWAARVAIEHQPVDDWGDRALEERDPAKQVEALLALARAAGIDPQHRQPADPPVDEALRGAIIDALLALDWQALDHDQQLTLVRTYEIVFNRFGKPDDTTVDRILAQLSPQFPAPTQELNWLLCETLVYLQSPDVAAKAVDLLLAAPTQEEQLEYARSLRMLKAGWTPETRTAYFEWLLRAASSYRGGASFEQFVKFIRDDAVATLTDEEQTNLAELLARQPVKKSPLEGLAEMFKDRTPTPWTLEEVSSAARTGLQNRNYDNGRRMFAATACFNCHRFGNEGGMTGPDLTVVRGRYTPHDLIDQIINPSKEINEQFVPMHIITSTGLTVTGVIVNLNGDTVSVNTDPSDPNQQVRIDRKEVELMEQSKVSPMPQNLLNPLTKEEILDLLAYVLSGGNRDNPMFEPAEARTE